MIERPPYLNLIARYDRPTTLFYLGPPYWGCEVFAAFDIEAVETTYTLARHAGADKRVGEVLISSAQPP